MTQFYLLSSNQYIIILSAFFVMNLLLINLQNEFEMKTVICVCLCFLCFRIVQRVLSIAGVHSLVNNLWGYVDTTIR